MLSALPGERRMDAEFWQPRYIDNVAAVSAHAHTTLGDLVTTFRKGIFYILASDYVESGIPFYRSANVQSIIPSDSGLAFITAERDRLETKTSLRRGDIMLAKTGKYGASVVLCDRCNVSQDVIAVKVKRDRINPLFLAVYLNTKPGQLELRRWFQGQVQEHLSLPDAKRILVPLLSTEVQQSAQDTIEDAEKAFQKADDTYAEVEALLESVLGLDKLDLTPRLFYEARFAEIDAAARMDADYFQPAKRVILAALSRMARRPIGKQFRPVRQLWQPDRAKPGDRVRNYDLTDALSPFLDDTLEPTTADQIGSTKKALAPGDIVISRLRSYLKEIAVVLPGGDTPLVGSSEFIVLRPNRKALSVEALLVYLRSPLIQTILKWCQDGSNHPRFDEKELLAIPIPEKVTAIEKELSAKVKAAIAARRESRRLLDTAKRAVEIAIEESESAALRFLKQERG